MYYFAYGLDISKKQMRQMCPDAKPVSTALLPHYKLVFIGWDRKWRGGTANIQYNRGARVMGAVYDVSERDLRYLDREFGCPTQADRLNVWAVPKEGDQVEAVTYLRKGQPEEPKPSPLYVAALRSAYAEWE